MRQDPWGAELLWIARDALRGERFAAPPEARKYTTLMVANAMAIAARQIEAGDGPARAAHARLAALLGRPAGTIEGAAIDDAAIEGAVIEGAALIADLRVMEAALGAAIRAGEFDPGTAGHQAARAHLCLSAEAAVAESNPRYLAGVDFRDAQISAGDDAGNEAGNGAKAG